MAASVSATALLKLSLHAAAHAQEAVIGALVGTRRADGSIDVADVLPLFHGPAAGMGPMLEVALLQVKRAGIGLHRRRTPRRAPTTFSPLRPPPTPPQHPTLSSASTPPMSAWTTGTWGRPRARRATR